MTSVKLSSRTGYWSRRTPLPPPAGSAAWDPSAAARTAETRSASPPPSGGSPRAPEGASPPPAPKGPADPSADPPAPVPLFGCIPFASNHSFFGGSSPHLHFTHPAQQKNSCAGRSPRMSLILSKQSGRLNAGLTKLPHSAGCEVELLPQGGRYSLDWYIIYPFWDHLSSGYPSCFCPLWSDVDKLSLS